MDVDVVVIGGGLAGSMASVMLARRGLKTVVLESRPVGKEQKVVVGEALTEGTSVFVRHEIGGVGVIAGVRQAIGLGRCRLRADCEPRDAGERNMHPPVVELLVRSDTAHAADALQPDLTTGRALDLLRRRVGLDDPDDAMAGDHVLQQGEIARLE